LCDQISLELQHQLFQLGVVGGSHPLSLVVWRSELLFQTAQLRAAWRRRVARSLETSTRREPQCGVRRCPAGSAAQTSTLLEPRRFLTCAKQHSALNESES
jgi:hypothetical protein